MVTMCTGEPAQQIEGMVHQMMRRPSYRQARIRIHVTGKDPPKWDRDRRLRTALANNNRGTWYVIRTPKTLADIERRFQEQSVATLLLQVVGGILGDAKRLRTEGGYYLYMQLSRLDGDVTMCLHQYLKAEVLEPISFSKIRHP